MSHKPLDIPSDPKFLPWDLVIHVKTHGIYQIVGTPRYGLRIESTGAPAYTYRSTEKSGNCPMWIRPQSEMEDGRFVLFSQELGKGADLVDTDWVPDRTGLLLFRCKSCSGEFPETFSDKIPGYKYCPHCGACFDVKKETEGKT